MSNEKTGTSDEVRFNVRVPVKLHHRLTLRARANGRSMNSEIIDMLENALGTDEQDRLEYLRAKMEDVAARLDAANREMMALDTHRMAIQSEITALSSELAVRQAGPLRK